MGLSVNHLHNINAFGFLVLHLLSVMYFTNGVILKKSFWNEHETRIKDTLHFYMMNFQQYSKYFKIKNLS